MADLKDFAEQLVNLTVKEVNELAQILKDEYGIEPAAAAVAVAGPAGGAGEGGEDLRGGRVPGPGSLPERLSHLSGGARADRLELCARHRLHHRHPRRAGSSRPSCSARTRAWKWPC